MPRKLTLGLGIAGLALASTTAGAFYWDIDMVDAEFVRAFEAPMRDLPEDTVSQGRYVKNYDRMTPQGQTLANPYPQTEASLALGSKMFDIYCETCHGVDGKGGAEVVRAGPGISRYPVPPAMLSGPGNSPQMRSDGYLYLTIRNGSSLMKGYGAQMDDHEMWAVVQYIRTLEGTAYTPPAPAEDPE